MVGREKGFHETAHTAGGQKTENGDKVTAAVEGTGPHTEIGGGSELKQFCVTRIREHGEKLVTDLTASRVAHHENIV